MATVERLHTGAGLNKQRAVCILLENPCLEDPMAHRHVLDWQASQRPSLCSIWLPAHLSSLGC